MGVDRFVSNNSFNVETLKYICLKEHMCYCQCTVTVGTLWLIFLIKNTWMGNASMTVTEPPEDNDIFTAETT